MKIQFKKIMNRKEFHPVNCELEPAISRFKSEVATCELTRPNWKEANKDRLSKLSENHKIHIYAKCDWRSLIICINLNFLAHFQTFLLSDGRARDLFDIFLLLNSQTTKQYRNNFALILKTFPILATYAFQYTSRTFLSIYLIHTHIF